MRFALRHETLYRYDVPVRLGVQLVRLTPRAEALGAWSHRLVIEPAPVWRADEIDGFGNAVTRVGFAGETVALRLTRTLSGETLRPLAAPAALAPLPWLPPAPAAQLPFLAPTRPGGEEGSVRAFAASVMAGAGPDPLRFLDALTATLFARTDRQIRPEGDARPAAETLALGSGACRDLTVLFLAVCRLYGLPARFASGYQARAQSPDGLRHLHAWPEVHLPGAGWRGYDPTHGTAVTDGHLALAVAPDQAATMTLEGAFSADAPVRATLDYRLEIETD